MLTEVLQRFLLLIGAVGIGRELVMDQLTMQIQTRLDAVFDGHVFDDLDVLSSHTRPDGVEDIEIKITSFDDEWVHFSGSGTISCELQYGSDGDVRRDDGLVMDDSYPFTFSGRTPTENPAAVEIERDSIEIDTSSFYE